MHACKTDIKLYMMMMIITYEEMSWGRIFGNSVLSLFILGVVFKASQVKVNCLLLYKTGNNFVKRLLLTHFLPFVSFYTPWKHQNTDQRDEKSWRDQLHEMGLCNN